MKVLILIVAVSMVTDIALSKVVKPSSKNHVLHYRKMFKAAYIRYKGKEAFQELLRSSTPKEIRQRIKEFKKFVTLVDDVNDGGYSYSASINHVTIMTKKERIRKGIYLNDKDLNTTYWKEMYDRTKHDYVIPETEADRALRQKRATVNSINWVKRGAVFKPRNQKTCWSCWAFSGAISIESNYYLTAGDKVEMSKQEILDCAVEHYAATKDKYYRNNDGCDGGHIEWGLQYVIDKDHLTTTADLSYQVKDNACAAGEKKNALKKAKVIGIRLNENGDKGLQRLASDGIVSVSLQTTDRFHVYREGIFVGDKQCMVAPTHSVNVVGFTPEFWYIKNTWGPYWGEGGYFKMGRKSKFDCLVARFAVMPVLECRDGASCNPPSFSNSDDSDSFGVPDYDATQNFYLGVLKECGTLEMGDRLCVDLDSTAKKLGILSGICDTIYCTSSESYIINRGTGHCLSHDKDNLLQHKVCDTETPRWEFSKGQLKIKGKSFWVQSTDTILEEGANLKLVNKPNKSQAITVKKELCWEEQRKKKYKKILKTKPSSYSSFEDAEAGCDDYGSKCQGIYYDSNNNSYKIASKTKMSGSKSKNDIVYTMKLCEMTCDAGYQRCENGRCMEKCDPNDYGCPLGTVRCDSGKCYHEHMCKISEYK